MNEPVLVRLVTRLLVLALVIGFVAWLVPGVDVEGGFGWLLWVAFLFSVVNTVLGPVLRLLSLPLIVVTFGLFLFLINAALLAITAGLSVHLDVDDLRSALVGGFLIAFFSWVAELVLPLRRRRGKGWRG